MGNKDLFLMREGDLILQVTFAWEGAIALCSKAEDGLYGSVRYPTFRVNEERCFAPFLAKYLCTRQGLDQIGRICPGSAGRNRVLAIKRLPEIMIPLPPLSEQRRIVARIEELAQKAEEARRLRRDATAVLQTCDFLHKKAIFTKLSNMSPMVALSELITLSSGNNLTSSQMSESAPYAVYGGGGLNGRFDRYMFEEPKIAIGRVGARCGCVFVTAPKSWITDNALFIDKNSETLQSQYLVFVLSVLDLRQEANQAAQPVVSQKKILPLQIPVPSLDVQSQVLVELDALQAKINAVKALQTETAVELDGMLPAILDKAFKGQL